MKEFILRPEILLALIIIVGCFVMIGVGIDGDMKGILGIATGWVFGQVKIAASK